MSFLQYYQAAGLKSNAAAAATGLVLPTTGSPPYVQTPDAAAFDITGAIGLVAKVKLADWTPASDDQDIVTKTLDSGVSRSWEFQVDTTGDLRFAAYMSGNLRTAQSSVATGHTDGTAYWIGISRDNTTVRFWTGGTGDTPSWSQLGSDRSFGFGGNTMPSNSEPVEIGSDTEGTRHRSTAITVEHVRIYDGVGAHTAPDQGTLIADPDFTTQWTDTGGTEHTDTQGNTWTIYGTGYSWE